MKKIHEKLALIFFWTCALITAGALISLIVFLVKRGIPSLSIELIFGNVSPIKALLLKQRVFDGLFPAIVGTFMVTTISVLMALPVGIASGIYLAEFSGPKIKNFFNFSLDILASIPSIVIGLFGLTITIFLHKYFYPKIYPCILISCISLAILILPYIVRTTQLSLEAVPISIRLAGICSGASKMQNLYYVLIPYSMSGMLSGIILALGRAAEDTAVIMLTGVVATAGIPSSLLEKYEALPFYIYYISSQYTDQNELMKGFGAAIILLFICTILFVFAHIIKRGIIKYINKN